MVLTQVLTAVFLANEWSNDWSLWSDLKFWLLTLSTALITFCGYLINDYYDVKIDYVNKPQDVVIGTHLKRRHAMFLHTSLNFIGISMATYISWKLGLIHFVVAFMLWLYSNQLKRLPLVGNLVVASLTALSIWIVALYFNQNHVLVGSFAVFAFAVTLIREVIKDIEDMEGDKKFGCRTLPIVFGIRKTKDILYVLAFLFLAILFVLAYFLGNLTFSIYAGLLVIPVYLFVYYLKRADTRKHFSDLSAYCKYLMMSGILSMIFF